MKQTFDISYVYSVGQNQGCNDTHASRYDTYWKFWLRYDTFQYDTHMQ